MNKVSVRAFCKDVAEIKALAKKVLNSEDKFACVEAYLDICRMCENRLDFRERRRIGSAMGGPVGSEHQ